jgi:hypothetical protein
MISSGIFEFGISIDLRISRRAIAFRKLVVIPVSGCFARSMGC